MNTIRNLVLIALFAGTALVSACQHEGPAERAGKGVDNAVKKTGEVIEDAGDKVKDATR